MKIRITTKEKDMLVNNLCEAINEKVIWTSDELDKLVDWWDRFFEKSFEEDFKKEIEED